MSEENVIVVRFMEPSKAYQALSGEDLQPLLRVDAFGAIDLADPRQVCGDEPAVRDPTHRG